MSEHPCPKCSDTMVQGFTADFAHGSVGVSHWFKGPPKTFFFGVKARNGTPIATFRCPGCGYLEHYADSRFKPE
ncbi:MAG: hypothetical protein VCG02_07545 [Verrucomicrobiota bacterium]